MRVLVDIGHPAHVHFFKNFIREMQKRNHQVLVTAREKDVALNLLRAYGIEYTAVGKKGKGKVGLITEWLGRDLTIWGLARKFLPDVLTGNFSPCAAHVSRVTGARSIIFNDSELAGLQNWVTQPFAHVVVTPSSFKNDLGRKHVRFQGYKELAYLHPNNFKPNPSVLRDTGLTEQDRFSVVRFIAWGAGHDIGRHGFDLEGKTTLVSELAKHGRVLITSEDPLPAEFEKYRFAASPEKIHDLLHYAAINVGDSQTMATEAAVLGTPAVRCNSFVDPNDMGNFVELENKYDLMYSFSDAHTAIAKSIELVQRPDLKKQWAVKRQKLLEDKTDVTAFVVDFIENYPESFRTYKKGIGGCLSPSQGETERDFTPPPSPIPSPGPKK